MKHAELRQQLKEIAAEDKAIADHAAMHSYIYADLQRKTPAGKLGVCWCDVCKQLLRYDNNWLAR